MLDWPAIWPYVTGLLNARPHHHASDAIVEHGSDLIGRPMGWHIDGHDDGYRNLGTPIPLLQLKIGYYLSDMTQPGQGNLCVVPGSHKTVCPPDRADLQQWGRSAGVTDICAPAGTAILFHNALWHSAGPFTRLDGQRAMLYYAYEHPWMNRIARALGLFRRILQQSLTCSTQTFPRFSFQPTRATLGMRVAKRPPAAIDAHPDDPKNWTHNQLCW